MTRYILDTDHLSLFQRGHESLKTHFVALAPEQLAITIVSVEEQFRGRLAQVRRANLPEERVNAYYWLSKTVEFLRHFTILPYDAAAEAYFQTILAHKIRIGVQDLKIAAIALSQQATLLTRNKKDFGRIVSLSIEDWSSQI